MPLHRRIFIGLAIGVAAGCGANFFLGAEQPQVISSDWRAASSPASFCKSWVFSRVQPSRINSA